MLSKKRAWPASSALELRAWGIIHRGEASSGTRQASFVARVTYLPSKLLSFVSTSSFSSAVSGRPNAPSLLAIEFFSRSSNVRAAGVDCDDRVDGGGADFDAALGADGADGGESPPVPRMFSATLSVTPLTAPTHLRIQPWSDLR